jgi:hypothetical protein
MAQTKFQVSLSVDGQHSVSVQSDDPAAVTEGLVWARDTYKKLITFGHASQSNGDARPTEPSVESRVYPPADDGGDAPRCGVHDVPMVLMHGRRGDFWSCHEKNSDGSWCSYKPPR